MSRAEKAGPVRRNAAALTALLLLLLPHVGLAGGGEPPTIALSALGDARANGVALAPGRPLGRDATVRLAGRGAAAQLLARGVLAVSLWGRGEARIDARGARPSVTLQADGIRARLSGIGRAITAGRWRIALDPGSSVLVEGPRVFVLRGSVALAAPPDARCTPASQPAAPEHDGARAQPATTVSHAQAGERALLGANGCATVSAGSPDKAALAPSAAYAPPPPWQPASDAGFSAAAIRAVRVMRAEQRTEQETASCGCTESTGAAAGPVGQGAAEQPLERRNATLRVRVTGVPRGGAR